MTETCALCDRESACQHDNKTEVWRFNCAQCGPYYITQDDKDDFLGDQSKRLKHHAKRLSLLVQEQYIRGLPPLYLQFTEGPYPNIDDARPERAQTFLASQWPSSFPERLDRALCNLCRLSSELDELGCHVPSERALPASLFAKTSEEAYYVTQALCESGYI
ncbi:unnamed protein product, partial [marine sediment metagenome]